MRPKCPVCNGGFCLEIDRKGNKLHILCGCGHKYVMIQDE